MQGRAVQKKIIITLVLLLSNIFANQITFARSSSIPRLPRLLAKNNKKAALVPLLFVFFGEKDEEEDNNGN